MGERRLVRRLSQTPQRFGRKLSKGVASLKRLRSGKKEKQDIDEDVDPPVKVVLCVWLQEHTNTLVTYFCPPSQPGSHHRVAQAQQARVAIHSPWYNVQCCCRHGDAHLCHCFWEHLGSVLWAQGSSSKRGMYIVWWCNKKEKNSTKTH